MTTTTKKDATTPVPDWRTEHPVHPAADVFPMMPEGKIKELAEDILLQGLRIPILLWDDRVTNKTYVIDGRNRLAALYRAGITPTHERHFRFHAADRDSIPSLIIALNIRRRHLTKSAQADLIVATMRAAKKFDMATGATPKRTHNPTPGKRGGSTKDTTRAAILEKGKEHDIGTRTMTKSIAKSEGKMPAPRKKPAPPVTIETTAVKTELVKTEASPKTYTATLSPGGLDNAFQQMAADRKTTKAATEAQSTIESADMTIAPAPVNEKMTAASRIEGLLLKALRDIAAEPGIGKEAVVSALRRITTNAQSDWKL